MLELYYSKSQIVWWLLLGIGQIVLGGMYLWYIITQPSAREWQDFAGVAFLVNGIFDAVKAAYRLAHTGPVLRLDSTGVTFGILQRRFIARENIVNIEADCQVFDTWVDMTVRDPNLTPESHWVRSYAHLSYDKIRIDLRGVDVRFGILGNTVAGYLQPAA